MKSVKKNKNKRVRKLASDQEYVTAFLSEKKPETHPVYQPGKENLNRHGLPFVDDYAAGFGNEPPASDPGPPPLVADPDEEVDFSELLAQSLKVQPPPKKAPKPVSLKKRLQRYPGPEADLDLHGFTAIGAQLKARSFVQSGLAQGYFTLRIIVGRGLHSDEGPVLPQIVAELLNEMKDEKSVLAFEWEGGKKRKGGALLVYLNQFND